MSSIVLELNPRVREIIERALEAAKPFWTSVLENNVEVWPRHELYLDFDGFVYVSVNRVEWLSEFDHRVYPTHIGISETKAGPFFVDGPLTPKAWMQKGIQRDDRLVILPGHLTFAGILGR